MGTLSMVAMVSVGVLFIALARANKEKSQYLMVVSGIAFVWIGVFALGVSAGYSSGAASVMGAGVLVGVNLMFRHF